MPRASNAVTKESLEQFGITLSREIRTAAQVDLAEMRTAAQGDLAEMRAAVQGDLTEVRAALQGDLAEMRAAVQGDLTEVRAALQQQDVTLTGEIRAVCKDLTVEIEKVAVHLNRNNASLDALKEQVHKNGVRFEQFQSSVYARFEWVISSTNRLSGETNRLSGEVAELRNRFDRHDVASLDRRVTTLEKKRARR